MMKKIPRYLFWMLLAIFFYFTPGCCSKRYDSQYFNFTSAERQHFAPYRLKDTIYFESESGDIDTIQVIKINTEVHEGKSCFVSRAPQNSKGVVIKHLPVDHWHSMDVSPGASGQPEYQTLISLDKYPLRKKRDYSIGFRNFYARLSTLDTLLKTYQINGHTLTQCYKIAHSYPDRVQNPQDIQWIYWTKQYGLTAYTNKKNETWVIKKLP